MIEQFTDLYNRADKDAVIPFLQKLEQKERRELVPFLKKELKRFEEWDVRQGFQGEEKIYILRASAFVCFTEAEIKTLRWWNFPPEEELEKILPWYCPTWLSNYINSENEFNRKSYLTLMDWTEKGYITPTAERIVAVLPNVIFKEDKRNSKIYEPERIEKYPVTLNEHIWYLFEYPSNIDWADRWYLSQKEIKNNEGNWIKVFIHYTANGRLNRMKVLKECLLTANRNYNKILTGWFSALFIALKPTAGELLEMQDELFATLNCVQSKPVNTTLNLFKKLCIEERFQTNEFLPYLPILFSSEVKSIIATTLVIIENILKKKPENSQEICISLCTAFLSKDEAIQKKTAELISRYATPGTEINEALAAFSDNLLMSVQPILTDYLEKNKESADVLPDYPEITEPAALLREDNRIPSINSFEDFAFFLSQALDQPEAYYFDLLANNLIAWGNQVDEDSLILLEPVFQKAYKIISQWDTPAIDGLLCYMIVAYGNQLMKQFPAKLSKIEKIRTKAIENDIQRDKNSEYYSRRLVDFEKLSISTCFEGFYRIAGFTLKKMKTRKQLPLLSTPTHSPGWIDPATFVERLYTYQQLKEEPEEMDMQLALQRCAPENISEATRLAQEKLSGEYKDLLLFLLGVNKSPKGEFLHPSWWMIAGITRSPECRFPEFSSFEYNEIPEAYLFGNHSWESYMREYMAYGNYNREKKDYDRYPATTPDLHWLTPDYENRENSHTPLFLEYTLKKKEGYQGGINENNIQYLLTAFPNMPDNYYGRIVFENIYYGCNWEVAEQTQITTAITFMQQIATPFREMHYLFLAICLLAPDKTVRNYASQIWIDRVASETIDNERLGIALGKIERLELCPLKRLTDLMSESLTGVSPLHSKALLETVEAMCLQLQVKPIKNLKKLLEIYSELLAQCKQKPRTEMIARLGNWEKEGSLKKIAKQLIGNQ